LPVALKELLHAASGTAGRTAVLHECQLFFFGPAVHGPDAAPSTLIGSPGHDM
jgi:hypothetical protein